jgi:hypothetical protein
MTKKIVMAYLIIGTTSYQCFSQDFSLMPTKKDSVPVEKFSENEIVLNIETILFYAVGGRTFDSRSNNFGIMYKHRIEKSASRFGITYVNNSNYDLPYPDNNTFPSSTTITTSGTISYLRGYLNVNNIIGVSGGYEYLIGKRKTKQVIGMDANMAFMAITSVTQRETDSTNISPAGYGYGWIDEIGSYNSSLIKLGLFPFYGIKYPLSNHLSFSIQTGFEFYWIYGHVKYITENSKTYSQLINQSGLHADSFISDISLIYRF